MFYVIDCKLIYNGIKFTIFLSEILIDSVILLSINFRIEMTAELAHILKKLNIDNQFHCFLTGEGIKTLLILNVFTFHHAVYFSEYSFVF